MDSKHVADAGARVALVTFPDRDTAEDVVGRLVEERVVACGNILPGITSIYWWQGAVERGQETLVVFKTTGAGADRLVRRLPELHPYDTPEVLVLPVSVGHQPYIDWIVDNVGGDEEGL